MPYPKIATCSFCGTRAALVLTGETRHELSCAACGAPLHDLKALKAPSAPAEPKREHRHAPEWTATRHPPRPGKRRRGRPRKTAGRRLLSEIVDLIEDLLD